MKTKSKEIQGINIRENICHNIGNWIETNDVSYTEFARNVGVTDTSVKRWISCDCIPDINLLPVISKYMNISLSELMGIPASDFFPKMGSDMLLQYAENEDFKNLIDKYNNDPEFKTVIDLIVKISN